jgi:hypothetical protein
LPLAFLIDTQHPGIVWWIPERDDVVHLLDKDRSLESVKDLPPAAAVRMEEDGAERSFCSIH